MENYQINLKNISKTFGTNQFALKLLNFSVEAGQVSAIIGPSGAGKSTLLRCLSLLERPTEGEIWIDGKEMLTLSKKELAAQRREMGVVFQNYQLFASRTVLENLLFPLEIAHVEAEKGRRRAQELLKLVELPDKEGSYPAQLSGGQKQRVAIARALATNPKILLCDEPTSALDPRTTKQILSLLKKVNQQLGITIVIITHEMALVKEICSHLYVLDQGEIVESGSVKDLFTQPTHPATKRLLAHMTHEPPTQFKREKDKDVVRLCFRGESAKEPIISRLIRECDVEVNILLGSIDQLLTETIGNLIVELRGSEEQRKRAYRFLQERSIIVELLS